MVDEVGPDRVVPVHRKRDLQFRPDAVDAGNEHRLAHPGKIRRKEPAEAANLSQHFRSVRLPNESMNAALQSIAEIDVNASARISLLHGKRCRATAPVANRFPHPGAKFPTPPLTVTNPEV